jgi:hypothetical protein
MFLTLDDSLNEDVIEERLMGAKGLFPVDLLPYIFGSLRILDRERMVIDWCGVRNVR